ncbi:transcriptional regulator, AraC family [Calothrix sp. PCC 7716]|nr:transcriptional regulator, AraC family [Calothrix sp. PCC 7716]
MSENPIIVTEEEKVLEFYPRPPILTSFQANWNGVSLGYMRQPALEFPEVSTPRWHSIGIFTHGNRVIYAERQMDGRRQLDAVAGGDIVITPANIGHQAVVEGEGEFILLGIEPHIFARAINEGATPEEVELLPCFSTPEPLVYQIGMALKNILVTNPVGSRLYAETMVSALSVHLIEHYSTRKPTLHEYPNGLSRYKLQQVTEYINEHLDQDLGLEELAQLVQMSQHYFSQMFKQSLGMTPHQYVIRRRVERAKEFLYEGKLSIAQIAQTVGFANQSHLNFHFKRLLGVTPRKFLTK